MNRCKTCRSSPMPEMLALPSWPIMTWSMMLKEARSILCSVTGKAMCIRLWAKARSPKAGNPAPETEEERKPIQTPLYKLLHCHYTMIFPCISSIKILYL